jgi:hypothetical protein
MTANQIRILGQLASGNVPTGSSRSMQSLLDKGLICTAWGHYRVNSPRFGRGRHVGMARSSGSGIEVYRITAKGVEVMREAVHKEYNRAVRAAARERDSDLSRLGGAPTAEAGESQRPG